MKNIILKILVIIKYYYITLVKSKELLNLIELIKFLNFNIMYLNI